MRTDIVTEHDAMHKLRKFFRKPLSVVDIKKQKGLQNQKKLKCYTIDFLKRHSTEHQSFIAAYKRKSLDLSNLQYKSPRKVQIPVVDVLFLELSF